MNFKNDKVSNTVRFTDEVTVHETVGHLSSPESEKHVLWFTDDDYIRIMKNRNKSIRRFRRGKPESHLHSSIGLEYLQSRDHFEQYRIVKETVISAVIMEQNKAKQRQSTDEEPNVSDAPRLLSRWSIQKAVERAETLRCQLI